MGVSPRRPTSAKECRLRSVGGPRTARGPAAQAPSRRPRGRSGTPGQGNAHLRNSRCSCYICAASHGLEVTNWASVCRFPSSPRRAAIDSTDLRPPSSNRPADRPAPPTLIRPRERPLSSAASTASSNGAVLPPATRRPPRSIRPGSTSQASSCGQPDDPNETAQAISPAAGGRPISSISSMRLPRRS